MKTFIRRVDGWRIIASVSPSVAARRAFDRQADNAAEWRFEQAVESSADNDDGAIQNLADRAFVRSAVAERNGKIPRQRRGWRR